MNLIICEKPSMGRTVASALGATNKYDGYMEGNGYIVSWCFGHLWGLKDLEMYLDSNFKHGDKAKWSLEALPFYPENWKFEYFISDPGNKKQDKILYQLMKRSDVDTIYASGDADREGEVIVRNEFVQHHITGKKILRLWLPALTPEAIREAVRDARPDSEYDGYDNAGRARAFVDWLFGINLSRYATLKAGTKLNIGRCMCPIVSKIVQRDNEIKNFVPQKYLAVESGDENSPFVLKSKQKFAIQDAKLAQALCDKYNAAGAVVSDITTKISKIKSPRLFSQSDLQSYICKMNKKMSPQNVLDTVQSLYEKGFVTYPRTSSNFLAETETAKADQIIHALTASGISGIENKPGNKNIYDNSKVESHSALTPTEKIPDALSDTEKEVYEAIKNRFCAVFCSEDYLVNKTTIEISCADETFSIQGNIMVQPGWTVFEEPSKKDKVLPAVNKSDRIQISFKPVEKETTPPKRYTVESLNAWMKAPMRGEEDLKKKVYSDEEWKDILADATICTEATRAATLDKCIKEKYIALKDGTYSSLEKGHLLVDAMKQLHIDLSPAKTVELQRQIHDVQLGTLSYISILESTKKIIDEIIGSNTQLDSKFAASITEKKNIGICPRCGSPVYEGKLNFYCSEGKECGFALWKSTKLLESMKVSITATRAQKMLENKKVFVKGLYSKKKDSKFDAFIAYEDTGTFVNYKLEFGKT
ncbi:MAG: hypothetical protein J6O61_07835 [Butyrivibrio sp.]|uniref:DNA topoisomerase n=1 Tax=Butyrivibrio sp. TaxID=28121 RepID=UPI001B17A158|nr:DNA topoisomerase [Butyrivibrio sp.]MBO6240724.1 hypothetical protein [Butyrivibrio sp.]